MVVNSEGVSHNPTKLVSGGTRTHRHLHKAIINPATEVTKTREMIRAQTTSQDEAVEDQTADHDGDPVIRGTVPGRMVPEPVADDREDDEGDPLHIHPPQGRQRIGTPNSRCWRIMTDEGEKRGITGETLEQNTSKSS
jgi:hypothetical protein